jgi:hypothetical protein
MSRLFTGRPNKIRRNVQIVQHSCIILICAWLSIASTAQESQTAQTHALPPSHKASPAPFSHIYMHFLLYQNHLDQAAAEREKQGKDGAWLRDHFQQKLGFSGTQFALIRASAHRLDSKLKANRTQALTIIQNDRARRQSDLASPMQGMSVAALKALSKEREDLISREEADLDRNLGPDAAIKLQAFLKNDFVRKTHPRAPWGTPPLSRPKVVRP